MHYEHVIIYIQPLNDSLRKLISTTINITYHHNDKHTIKFNNITSNTTHT